MAASRREKLVEVVREMFKLRERSLEGDRLDADGVPLRITRLTENVFALDIQFHVPGRGPQAFSGGMEDYHGYHAQRVRKTEDKLDLELLDILASESRAAALIRYRDEHGGVPYEWLRVNVYTFDEAGEKIVEIHVYEHDQYLVDECFSKAYS